MCRRGIVAAAFAIGLLVLTFSVSAQDGLIAARAPIGQVVDPGNTLTLDFDPANISGGAPPGWGTSCVHVNVGPTNGGAFWYQILPPSPKGYTTTLDFILASTSMVDGTALTLAISKAAGDIYTAQRNWRLYLRRTGANYRFLFVVDEDAEEAAYEYPTVGSISLGTVYHVQLTYDITHQRIAWAVNGVTANSVAMIPGNPQNAASRFIGSSQSSDARNTTYLLDNVTWTEIGTTVTTASPVTASSAPLPPATLRVPKISWSIDANPANDPAIVTAAAYRANTAGQIAAYAKAREAGVDHLQGVFKWNEVEATLGVYDFAKVDTLVANSGDLPLVLNIAPIWDDGSTVLPGGLAFGNFTDAAVVTAYQNMLTALQSHLKGRLYILNVGNEADTYLTTASRRTQYAGFLLQARAWARTLFGTNPFKVSTCLRSSTAATWSDWADIEAVTDLNCFTYYPPVPTTIDAFVAQVMSDFSQMTGTRPAMFQEVGLSSTATGSSEALQTAAVQVLSGVIALVATTPNRLISVVTWSQLEDLSAAVISSFGYSSGQFTAGIGLRTTADAPKAAYSVICGFFGGTNCNAPPPPACTFSLAKASDMFTSAAGSGSVVLTTQTGCAWTLSVIGGTPAWLTIGAASGTGTTTLTYSVLVNTGTVGRSATAVVGGLNFSVSQDGAQPPPPPPACDFTLSKTSDTFTAPSGNDTLSSTANDSTCTWTAAVLNGATWLTLDSYSGTGTHTFTYSVTTNTSEASRTAQFKVSAPASGLEHLVTIVQDGTTPPVDPDPVPDVACTSTTPSPTGGVPIFLWSPCVQDKLNREYADYLCSCDSTVPGSTTPTLGGKIFTQILYNFTNRASLSVENLAGSGLYLYQATGNTVYAQGARDGLLNVWLTGAGAALDPASPTYACSAAGAACWDPSAIRESAIRLVVALDWLRPYLSAAEEDEVARRIENNIETHLGYFVRSCTGVNANFCISNGANIGDSDQLLGGGYFAIVMLHLLRPSDARATAMFNYAGGQGGAFYTNPVGGLTTTHAPTEWFSQDHTMTQRDTVKAYVSSLAEGGEWMESTDDYNPGTLRLLMEGYKSVKTATGTDYFPEITAFLPKLGERLAQSFTPDLEQSYQWGDNEHPRSEAVPGRLWEYTLTIAEASGLLKDQAIGRRLNQLVVDLIAKHGFVATVSNTRGIASFTWPMIFDPYIGLDDWRVNTGLFARGVGLGLHRDGFATTGSLFMAFAGRWPIATVGTNVNQATAVDHLTNYQHLRDFRLWKNHEWVLDHPVCYGIFCLANASEGMNGVLTYGMNSMPTFKSDNVTGSYDSAHMYFMATTGGSAVIGSGRNDLPFVMENTGSVLEAPGTSHTVITFDRVNVFTSIASTELSKFDAAGGYDDNPSQDLFSAYPSKEYILHQTGAPTINANEITWTTPGSQNVKWTVVTPSVNTKAVVAEKTLTTSQCKVRYLGWGSGAGCQAWNSLPDNEKGWHVSVKPSADAQFVTFLNVIQVGTPGVITAKSNNSAEGAHVTRPGDSDLLVMFNAVQGPNLTAVSHDIANHVPALRVVRYRSVGYTIPWTAVGTSTLIYLHDLNPNATWTMNVDAAGAVTVVPCSANVTNTCLDLTSGEYRTTVAGAGAHTFTLIGDGAPLPPDPSTCPTITLGGTLVDGTVGIAYSRTLTASGGTAPYGYFVETGTLPPGLTFHQLTGVLDGTPTLEGEYTFVLRASQADGCFGHVTYTITVGAAVTNAIARTGTPATFADSSGAANSINYTVTMGSGSNRLALAWIMANNAPSCTFNAVAMTLNARVTQVPGDFKLYLLSLVAPATGSHVLACTFATPTVIGGFFQGYIGVDQTTPIGPTSEFTSSNASAIQATVTPIVTNAWTVLFNRSWYAQTAGQGSTLLLTSPGLGIGLFDAGPHPVAGVARTMNVALAASGPVGGFITTINPVVP